MSIGYMGFMIVGGILSFIGMFVSGKLKKKIDKYSRVGVASNLSGAEVAKKMLDHYGIHDVSIQEGKGLLSDHYNPQSKVIKLSPLVFRGRNVAASAVAAHECGHAVQHAEAYSMLTLRSKLVPVIQVASRAQQFLLLAAFMVFAQFPQLMLVVIATFALTALFSFVTLPVEFDASSRALAWLDESGIAQGAEYDGAKDALWWAAMTYVAGALSALVMFLYLLMSYSGRN